MTNSDIVKIVYNEYKLNDIIKKLNKNCNYIDDFESEIYLLLMELDNDKLNNLHSNNELKGWIIGIIKNQRNEPNSYINKTYKIYEHYSYNDKEDEIEHDFRLDFIEYILEQFHLDYDWFKAQELNTELRLMMAIEILKLYYLKRKRKIDIICQFDVGMSTLNTLLKDGKEYIEKMFKKKYQLYLENKLEIWK